jgi:hypothetical protein
VVDGEKVTPFIKLLSQSYVNPPVAMQTVVSPKQIVIEPKKYAGMCMTIAKKLISNEESLLLYTPITQKYYIRNNNLGIFMVIDNGVLSITNHSYSYEIKLTGKSERILIIQFEKELELRADNMDIQILNQIKDSLINAYNQINNY